MIVSMGLLAAVKLGAKPSPNVSPSHLLRLSIVEVITQLLLLSLRGYQSSFEHQHERTQYDCQVSEPLGGISQVLCI
jgi:hypothetical protein